MDRNDALRAWAKGSYPQEAATELLIRAFGGRFAGPGCAWVGIRDDGGPWIDFDAIPDAIGGLSGGEKRFLLLTASLGGGSTVNLNEVLSLDRDLVRLVLAAVAHASGSHQGAEVVDGPDGSPALRRVTESLYPWPAIEPGRRLRLVDGGA